ncbi:RDD family protein [Streptomyces sp. SCA3-4]|uniref:RDD family protein n=1 Tax=Streptomyces sichuanensis TaxID=2871810 RepID=UPI001CE36776|nr:RDD family protein [Streptomyces sichuanensis]MCA6090910.1 RDD family protein [Streptomyces sichuanensis]
MSDYQQYPSPNPYTYGAQQQFDPRQAGFVPLRPGPPEEVLANPGARLGARLLDIIFLILVIMILGLIVGIPVVALSDSESAGDVAFATAAIGALVLYDPLMTYAYGATFGKRICGLRVARLADADKLSLGAALGRWLVYLLIGLIPFGGLVNVLSCLWDKPYRQCFHDKAVGSVVVNHNA